mgnify:CR=1 FL=1
MQARASLAIVLAIVAAVIGRGAGRPLQLHGHAIFVRTEVAQCRESCCAGRWTRCLDDTGPNATASWCATL